MFLDRLKLYSEHMKMISAVGGMGVLSHDPLVYVFISFSYRKCKM